MDAQHHSPDMTDAAIENTAGNRQPGYAKTVAAIMADGEWHTAKRVWSLLRETFPAATLRIVQNAIRGVFARPPSGTRLVSKRIGRKCQYRLRKVVHAPVELVTSLMEGAQPVIEELNHWARQNQYEIPPSAMASLAARLERLFQPLKESVVS